MRLVLFIILLPMVSCSFFEKEEVPHTIARVGNKYLLHSDIEGIIPKNTPAEDSVLIMDNFIQNWIKENLVLQKAEINLSDNQKDFQKQLDDYRKSLIIYSYEKELISKKLDTNVSNEEIKAFYENNKQNFELSDDILKVIYLKVPKNAPQIKKIRKVYKSDKEKDVEKLKEYAHQYAEKFFLNSNQWILFDELLNEVPINVSQRKEFLNSVKNIEVEDSLSYYFVLIKDYRLKKDVAPLSFEKRNIKSIIINKRKLSLMTKIKNEMYQEALLKKDVEIFDVKKDDEN